MGQGAQRGAHRRLLPGRVAVEAEERGRREPPEQAELRLGQRRAERRDRLADARPGRARSRPSGLRRRSPGSRARLAGAAWSRLNRVRPLSNKGVSGEFRYLGSPAPRMRRRKGDHPPARVADREHQAAAEAVVGLAFVILRLDQQPGLDQLLVAESLRARPSACRANVRARSRSRSACGSPRRRRAVSR